MVAAVAGDMVADRPLPVVVLSGRDVVRRSLDFDDPPLAKRLNGECFWSILVFLLM